MTAEQIIQEIESLSLEEQAKIIRFAYRLDGERQLTGRELSALAKRMAQTTDPAEALVLREEFTRGFYGGKANAQGPAPTQHLCGPVGIAGGMARHPTRSS